MQATDKGRRLENQVAKEYRKIGVDAKRMPRSGAFSHFKSDISKRYNDGWHDECKNQETLKLREWYNQAKSTCGSKKPLLHVSSNFRPILTIMSAEHWADFCLELEHSGQPFLHDDWVVDKSKVNLWDEHDKARENQKYGALAIHLNHLGLVAVEIWHFMEMYECLLNADNH